MVLILFYPQNVNKTVSKAVKNGLPVLFMVCFYLCWLVFCEVGIVIFIEKIA